MSEKNQILDSYDAMYVSKKELDFTYVLYVVLTFTFITIFLFPKVYISEQIYFKSRDIAKLKSEYDTLKEENKLIHASVESIKFKNQISDTLF